MQADNAAEKPELRPFVGEAEIRGNWPPLEHNFYRDPKTGEWIYRYAEDRIIAAVRDE